MAPDAVKAVFDQVYDDADQRMKQTLNEHVEDYPPQLFNLVWHGVKPVALDWIDENLPCAFNRPMFADNFEEAQEETARRMKEYQGQRDKAEQS